MSPTIQRAKFPCLAIFFSLTSFLPSLRFLVGFNFILPKRICCSEHKTAEFKRRASLAFVMLCLDLNRYVACNCSCCSLFVVGIELNRRYENMSTYFDVISEISAQPQTKDAFLLKSNENS